MGDQLDEINWLFWKPAISLINCFYLHCITCLWEIKYDDDDDIENNTSFCYHS